MVQVTKDPELRYTADSQLPIAEMMVEFPSLGADNKPALLKVVAWGDLAQQVNEKYHEGDSVIIEGRLNIDTIERPEGFKEKRAELTVSKIYPISSEASDAMAQDKNKISTNKSINRSATQQPSRKENYSNVVDLESHRNSTVTQESKANPLKDESSSEDLDFIPF